MTAPDLAHFEFDVCDLCLGNAGGECHVPGCVFWMDDAPIGALLRFLTDLHESKRCPS